MRAPAPRTASPAPAARAPRTGRARVRRAIVRPLVGAIAALALLSARPGTAASQAAFAPHLDRGLLESRIAAMARDARPARLGVAVLVPATDEQWSFAGREWFPMQSVFKAPLGAMVLDAVDHRRLRLDSTLVLGPRDLSPPYSVVADSFPARNRYTVAELMVRAVGSSDNMAADVLLGLVGGPHALTSWLEARQLGGIRVDRAERDLQPAILGLGAFRSEWAHEDRMSRAAANVPAPVRRLARDRYLSGTSDMLTPEGAVAFLDALAAGRLLPPASTARLLAIMTASTTGPHRLRAGLPSGATLAQKTGSGPTIMGVNVASNDIGLVTLADGRTVAIAVLFSGSTADEAARDSLHAAVARIVVEALK